MQRAAATGTASLTDCLRTVHAAVWTSPPKGKARTHQPRYSGTPLVAELKERAKALQEGVVDHMLARIPLSVFPKPEGGIVTVRESDTVLHAAEVLLAHSILCAPVMRGPAASAGARGDESGSPPVAGGAGGGGAEHAAAGDRGGARARARSDSGVRVGSDTFVGVVDLTDITAFALNAIEVAEADADAASTASVAGTPTPDAAGAGGSDAPAADVPDTPEKAMVAPSATVANIQRFRHGAFVAVELSTKASLLDVAHALGARHEHRVFVHDSHSGKLDNIITQSALLRVLHENVGSLGVKPGRSIKELGLLRHHTVRAGGAVDHGAGGRERDIITARVDESVLSAFKTMRQHRISGLAVVNAVGVIVGAVSIRDIRVLLHPGAGLVAGMADTLAQLLSRKNTRTSWHTQEAAVTCRAEDSLATVMARVVKNKIHRIFVVDADRRPVGALGLAELIMACTDHVWSLRPDGGPTPYTHADLEEGKRRAGGDAERVLPSASPDMTLAEVERAADAEDARRAAPPKPIDGSVAGP